MACFNKEIEWNYAYLKKIRLSFYRKLKDVKFAFKEPAMQAYNKIGKKGVEDDIEYLLSDQQPKVRIKV